MDSTALHRVETSGRPTARSTTALTWELLAWRACTTIDAAIWCPKASQPVPPPIPCHPGLYATGRHLAHPEPHAGKPTVAGARSRGPVATATPFPSEDTSSSTSGPPVTRPIRSGGQTERHRIGHGATVGGVKTTDTTERRYSQSPPQASRRCFLLMISRHVKCSSRADSDVPAGTRAHDLAVPTVVLADAEEGVRDGAPYDRIIVRHEAPCNRVEVQDLHHLVVAATE